MSKAPKPRWSRAAVAVAREKLQRDEPAATTAASTAASTDWRFHDAAAVLSSFEIHPTLHPLGRDAAADNAAMVRLIRDSICSADVDGRRRFILKYEQRRQALARLGSWDRICVALETNTSRPEDTLQRVFQAVVDDKLKPLAQLTLDELAATLQVLDWLPDSLRDFGRKLPLADDVRRRIDLETLRAPFTALATERFRGRKNELATLRDYVGVLAPSSIFERVSRGLRELTNMREKPPLVVYAPGGMGKSTIIARFILEHTGDTGRKLPFIYLDCDRPGLVPEEPLTLLLEGVRQLGVQFPAFAPAARDWIARWQNAASATPDDDAAHQPVKLTARARAEFLESCQVFIDELDLGDSPLLLVIDTFEEVQYRGRAYVREVWRFVSELQRLVPRLRTVVAGRARVDQPCEELPLDSLDESSAISFLEASGILNPVVAKTVARQVRRNPLSLRLAAQVLSHEGPGTQQINDLDTGGGLRKKVDDARIQGELFRRILSHVTREDVRKLAHPGLVLRRITPALIEKVLAGPCNVRVESQQQAHELFEALRREVSLVTSVSSGWEVRHRPDVRRVMLELLRKANPEAVRSIEENAVRFYQALAESDTAARAEEIYHRIGLGQDAKTITSRWMTGVEEHLRNAIEDFSGASQTQLANMLGVDVLAVTNEHLPDDSWLQAAEKQAQDLMQLGRTEEALAVIRSRKLVTGEKSLRRIEAQLLSQLGRVREARVIALETLATATEVSHSQDLELHRIIAQADDILDGELSEADPVGRYHALAKALPFDAEVLELGAQWCRILRRSAERTKQTMPAIQQLQAAIDDSVQGIPDHVLREVPWLLRQLRDERLVTSPGQVQRIGELLREHGERTLPADGSAGAVSTGLVRSSLDEDQRRKVAEALVQSFGTRSELELLIRSAQGPGLAALVGSSTNFTTAVLQIVKWAESLGLIGDLMATALKLRPDSVALRAVQAALDVVRYSSNVPTESLLVDGARPFVGREVLRKFMAGLGQPEAPNVLLVNGPRGAGKTYSCALMAYVARNSGSFDFGSIEVRQHDTPHDLAIALAAQGGWGRESMPPQGAQSQARLSFDLTQWTRSHTNTRRKPLLIAIDGLDEALPETIEFVATLARSVASASGSVMNLALLGFASVHLTTDTNSKRVMIEELGALTRTEVNAFLAAIAANHPVDAKTLEAFRRRALEKVGPLGSAQLRLNEFLGEVARNLLR